MKLIEFFDPCIIDETRKISINPLYITSVQSNGPEHSFIHTIGNTYAIKHSYESVIAKLKEA